MDWEESRGLWKNLYHLKKNVTFNFLGNAGVLHTRNQNNELNAPVTLI